MTVDVPSLGYKVIHDIKSRREFPQQIADSLFGHGSAAGIKGLSAYVSALSPIAFIQ